MLHSLTRKINNLSPNKKTFKIFVKKLKQTRKNLKRMRKKSRIKKA